MKFYTSDLHLDHTNMIRYCNRPFQDVKEMNVSLIKNINEVVTDNDDLYILGDLTLRSSQAVVTGFVNALKGHLHLVVGNHDYYADRAWARELFESVDWYKEIYDEGRKVILSHYPIYAWNRKKKGSYHLFGHVHQEQEPYDSWVNAFNVGVDVNNYRPVTLTQLIEERRTKIR